MRYIVFILVLLCLINCKEEPKQERVQEVEFRLDSTYFDFAQKDTFHNMVIEHLEGWIKDTIQSDLNTNPSYIVTNSDLQVAVIFSKLQKRAPNSFNYYQKLKDDNTLQEEILDLSNFIKNELKLTQVIMKNENQTIFKLIYDNNTSTDELNIYISNTHYSEKNILLIESILGQTNFINT